MASVLDGMPALQSVNVQPALSNFAGVQDQQARLSQMAQQMDLQKQAAQEQRSEKAMTYIGNAAHMAKTPQEYSAAINSVADQFPDLGQQLRPLADPTHWDEVKARTGDYYKQQGLDLEKQQVGIAQQGVDIQRQALTKPFAIQPGEGVYDPKSQKMILPGGGDTSAGDYTTNQKNIADENAAAIARGTGSQEFLNKVGLAQDLIKQMGDAGFGAVNSSGPVRALGAINPLGLGSLGAKTGLLPGADPHVEELRQQYNQVMSDLQLSVAAMKLKGGGAISDFERRLAENALGGALGAIDAKTASKTLDNLAAEAKNNVSDPRYTKATQTGRAPPPFTPPSASAPPPAITAPSAGLGGVAPANAAPVAKVKPGSKQFDASTVAEVQKAVAAGVPRDAILKRLQDNGYDTSQLGQ